MERFAAEKDVQEVGRSRIVLIPLLDVDLNLVLGVLDVLRSECAQDQGHPAAGDWKAGRMEVLRLSFANEFRVREAAVALDGQTVVRRAACEKYSSALVGCRPHSRFRAGQHWDG